MKVNYRIVKRILSFIFLIVIAANLIIALIGNKDHVFTSNYWSRYESLKSKYYNSIYANKKGNFIRDEYIYSFAAGSLIKGVSPILVNPETPPLGKYFISLSIILFNNEHVSTILFGVGSLFLLYFLSRKILESDILALFTVFILSFEPLFTNQFAITPLMDIVQVFFLLAFFIFFNKAEKSKNYLKFFILANVMLGIFISVKFFGTGITLISAAAAVLVLRKEYRRFLIYVVTSVIAPIILLAMYLPALVTGYPLKNFLGIQKWIFLYNMGHVSKFFTFLPLFLFNKWISWWNNSILSDSQWRITWPVSFFTFLFTLIGYFKFTKLRNKELDIILAWSTAYILLMQFGYVSARYFVILLPSLYLILMYLTKMIIVVLLKRYPIKNIKLKRKN